MELPDHTLRQHAGGGGGEAQEGGACCLEGAWAVSSIRKLAALERRLQQQNQERGEAGSSRVSTLTSAQGCIHILWLLSQLPTNSAC